MSNPGDFDPAKAVNFDLAKTLLDTRQQRAEAGRVQAEEAVHRAKVLETLRYAERQLDHIPNPFVSAFVIVDGPRRTKSRVEVGSEQRGETRYYGMWLALWGSTGGHNDTLGLVKLRQPPGGYACMQFLHIWRPQFISIDRSIPSDISVFLTYATLEEATGYLIRGVSNAGSVEGLAKGVRQALYFVATGLPPEPVRVPESREY